MKEKKSKKNDRKIDFNAPSVVALGYSLGEKPADKVVNTTSCTPKSGSTKKGSTESGSTNIGTTKNNVSVAGHTFGSRPIPSVNLKQANGTESRGRPFYRNAIVGYLNSAIGDNESAEIKLSVMRKELGINEKTLFNHLKALRDTEFEFTRLIYGTRVRKLNK